MANLLLTASNWKDFNAVTPPADWTGTQYTTDFSAGGGAFFELQFIGSFVDGDTFTANITSEPAGSSFGSPEIFSGAAYLNFVNTSGDVVWASPAFNSTTPTSVNIPAQAGSFVLAASSSANAAQHAYSGIIFVTPVLPPVPGPGFVLATGDTLSPSSGPGALTTMLLPTLSNIVGSAPSYVRAPWGAALVFYGGSPVYSLPLPEDVGLPAYEGAPKQKFTWRSKKFVFPGQTTFGAAKVVHSCAGGGVRFKLYIDCCCVFETVVRGCVPFRLPANLRGITCEIELSGCSRVTEVRVASSIRELMGDE